MSEEIEYFSTRNTALCRAYVRRDFHPPGVIVPVRHLSDLNNDLIRTVPRDRETILAIYRVDLGMLFAGHAPENGYVLLGRVPLHTISSVPFIVAPQDGTYILGSLAFRLEELFRKIARFDPAKIGELAAINDF